MIKERILNKLLSLCLTGAVGLTASSGFVYAGPDFLDSQLGFIGVELKDDTSDSVMTPEISDKLALKENKLPMCSKLPRIKFQEKVEKPVRIKAKYIESSKKLNKIEMKKTISTYKHFLECAVNSYDKSLNDSFDFRFINHGFMRKIENDTDILASIDFMCTNFSKQLYSVSKPSRVFNFSDKSIKHIICFCVQAVDACFEFQAKHSIDKKIFDENINNYSVDDKRIIYTAVCAMTLANIWDFYFSKTQETRFSYREYILQCFTLEYMIRSTFSDVKKAALFDNNFVERMKVLKFSLEMFSNVLMQFKNFNAGSEVNVKRVYKWGVGDVDNILLDILSFGKK